MRGRHLSAKTHGFVDTQTRASHNDHGCGTLVVSMYDDVVMAGGFLDHDVVAFGFDHANARLFMHDDGAIAIDMDRTATHEGQQGSGRNDTAHK